MKKAVAPAERYGAAAFLMDHLSLGGVFKLEGRRSPPLRPSGAHHLPQRGNIISPRFFAVNIVAATTHIVWGSSER
jgi:hypothetical protein